jgi:hypothetical protein
MKFDPNIRVTFAIDTVSDRDNLQNRGLISSIPLDVIANTRHGNETLRPIDTSILVEVRKASNRDANVAYFPHWSAPLA